MDIRGIKYFITAAECLNFTRAAKECYITQTAMSQNIASIEKELGFKLFERNNRNVQLTPAGQDFYTQMKSIVRSYESAVRHSRHISDGSEGRLSIVFPSGIEGLVFMPRLKFFKKSFPAIKLSANIAPPQRIPEMLRHGECDIAISWPYELGEMEGVTVQSIAEFKGALICSPTHRLSIRGKVTSEDLAQEKLIMLNLSTMPGTYRTMCNDWKKLGITLPSLSSFEHINHIEELLLAVCLDDSVALIPEFAKNYIGNTAVCLGLDIPSPITFKLCSAYLESSSNPVIRAALDILHDNRIPLNY